MHDQRHVVGLQGRSGIMVSKTGVDVYLRKRGCSHV